MTLNHKDMSKKKFGAHTAIYEKELDPKGLKGFGGILPFGEWVFLSMLEQDGKSPEEYLQEFEVDQELEKAKEQLNIEPECPVCLSKNVVGMSRVVGYFSIIENWNKSKQAELKRRQDGNYWEEEI